MNIKFFLDQHGCAKNQVDGELIVTQLEKEGYVFTQNADEADLIIVNSCGFINSAKQESLDSLLQARSAYPDKKIILAGCLAERYAENFKKSLPEADGIFGNGNIALVGEVVKKVLEGERKISISPQNGVCCGERKNLLGFPGTAFVKITEGCNNNCSFCAIPIIRGTLRSRRANEIVDEIRGLVEKGIYEINLIGQDLAAYGAGKDDDVFGEKTNFYDYVYGSKTIEQAEEMGIKFPLARLIDEISKLEGNFVVRLLYMHPDHFSFQILESMKKDSRFLPYFDIPFQSGSDSIISSMNRKGTGKEYISLVNKIREVFPDACIRTTFLCGFPGETDKDAEETEKFLESIQSDWSGNFPYSLEEDTPAYKFKKRVSPKKSVRRAERLTEIQNKITSQRLAQRVGKEYSVLIEEVIQNESGTDEGLAIGRAWFEAPDVDGSFVVRYDLDDKNIAKDIVPGKVVKVKATASSEFDLDGEYFGQ